MGIDTMALLRIPKLRVPKTEFGMKYLVEHRGDCSTLFTMNRFHSMAPDEHSLALRHVLGDALDAHDDPRGILFFPDVCEPKGQSYAELVDELADAGVWGPKVGLDHVPDRFTKATPGTFEALVFDAMHKLGSGGRAYVEIAEVLYNVQRLNPEPSRVEEYRAHMATLEQAMGRPFVQALEPLLEERRLAQERSAQARWQKLQTLMPAVLSSDDDTSAIDAGWSIPPRASEQPKKKSASAKKKAAKKKVATKKVAKKKSASTKKRRTKKPTKKPTKKTSAPRKAASKRASSKKTRGRKR